MVFATEDWNRRFRLSGSKEDSKDIAHRICLGTAQLGMDYGIANDRGRPSDAECTALLSRAIERGVLRWDTARSYGDAEARIGRFLVGCPERDQVGIVSKIPSPPPALPATELARWVTTEVDGSLQSLRIDQLADLLIHDTATIRTYGRAIWDAMMLQVDREAVRRIGLSVYDVDELQMGIGERRMSAVQLPMNLLDHRFSQSPLLEQTDDRGTTIYARSFLLQGALTMSRARLPASIAHLDRHLEQLEQVLSSYGVSCLDVALPFVLAHQQVDYVVIGVDDVSQLNDNLDRGGNSVPDGLLEELRQTFGELPAHVLEPRRWHTN